MDAKKPKFEQKSSTDWLKQKPMQRPMEGGSANMISKDKKQPEKK